MIGRSEADRAAAAEFITGRDVVDCGGGSDVVDGGAPVILRPRRRRLRVRLGVGLLLASSAAPPVDPNGGGASSELRLMVGRGGGFRARNRARFLGLNLKFF